MVEKIISEVEKLEGHNCWIHGKGSTRIIPSKDLTENEARMLNRHIGESVKSHYMEIEAIQLKNGDYDFFGEEYKIEIARELASSTIPYTKRFREVGVEYLVNAGLLCRLDK